LLIIRGATRCGGEKLTRHKRYNGCMYSLKEKLKYAKRLRKHGTKAEKKLRPYMWVAGYKYQEYDDAGYLPDFFSKYAGVAVEVDGSIHKRKEVKQMDRMKDRRRAQKHNYTMRVSNRAAENYPAVVAAEAILTGVIYKLYRMTVWAVQYLWWAVRPSPTKRPKPRF
jgi:very-short-patch-repair endonuclease